MEDSADLLENERLQMQRIVATQKVAVVILQKWCRLLLVLFAGLFLVFAACVIWRSMYSIHRFNATTRLLYNPRQVPRIQNMSDKQLLSVLDRESLKLAVAEKLPMGADERACLDEGLEIVQERRPSNLFTLTAYAPTWTGAVEKVNSYAQTLIGEYVNYRGRDLANWRSSLVQRKNGIQKQIAEVESEEAIVKGHSGVASPVETLTTINALMSDQRRNLSMISVQIANEEVRRAKLEAAVGPLWPSIVTNAATIRKKSAALEALDKDIAKLRELYTDLNPKVKSKLDDRQVLLADYAAFLKGKGIDGVTPEDIDRIEKTANDLVESASRMEALVESQKSLEQEIKANEVTATTLVAVIPSVERLRVKRTDLERMMREFDEQLDDITYLEASMANDLQQIERAGAAGDDSPFRGKNFVIAAGGAFVCTISLAIWLLFVELFFGKVCCAKELAAGGDVEVLGSLPKEGALSADEERDVLGVVALNFCNSSVAKGVALVCRLPGAKPQPKFSSVLDWSLSMSGQRLFTLNVVPNAGFKPPADGKPMINAVRKGSSGWFPVSNRLSLAPSELQMLQADLETLRKDFDCVLINMPEGEWRGSFFDQLLGASDRAVVVVGANATLRSSLAGARRRIDAAGKPMAGLVTGATADMVRLELDGNR